MQKHRAEKFDLRNNVTNLIGSYGLKESRSVAEDNVDDSGGPVMKFVPWLWRLVSNVGLLIRQGHTHGRLPMLRTYLKIEPSSSFGGIAEAPLTRESIFGYEVPLRLPHICHSLRGALRRRSLLFFGSRPRSR